MFNLLSREAAYLSRRFGCWILCPYSGKKPLFGSVITILGLFLHIFFQLKPGTVDNVLKIDYL